MSYTFCYSVSIESCCFFKSVKLMDRKWKEVWFIKLMLKIWLFYATICKKTTFGEVPEILALNIYGGNSLKFFNHACTAVL